MSEAQKLGANVKLCPHMWDSSIMRGVLGDVECIRNIDSIVDCEKAHCSWDPDKKSIHVPIKSQWSNGFNDANASVEKIRLEYFFDYPV